jgi:hypothetical protein
MKLVAHSTRLDANRNRRQLIEGSEEWQIMCKWMDAATVDYLEQALVAATFEQKEYARGCVDALKRIRNLPAELWPVED